MGSWHIAIWNDRRESTFWRTNSRGSLRENVKEAIVFLQKFYHRLNRTDSEDSEGRSKRETGSERYYQESMLTNQFKNNLIKQKINSRWRQQNLTQGFIWEEDKNSISYWPKKLESRKNREAIETGEKK